MKKLPRKLLHTKCYMSVSKDKFTLLEINSGRWSLSSSTENKMKLNEYNVVSYEFDRSHNGKKINFHITLRTELDGTCNVLTVEQVSFYRNLERRWVNLYNVKDLLTGV